MMLNIKPLNIDQVFCRLCTHHLCRFSLVCIKKLNTFCFPFVFQNTHAQACWAWYQVWSLTTRSLHPPIRTGAGYQRTPACWPAGRGGPCCPSPSPLPANGCRWILVRRSWWRGWSSREGSTVRTKSSWRSSALATATMAPIGGWCWTPAGTSQRWEFLFASVDHLLQYPWTMLKDVRTPRDICSVLQQIRSITLTKERLMLCLCKGTVLWRKWIRIDGMIYNTTQTIWIHASKNVPRIHQNIDSDCDTFSQFSPERCAWQFWVVKQSLRVNFSSALNRIRISISSLSSSPFPVLSSCFVFCTTHTVQPFQWIVKPLQRGRRGEGSRGKQGRNDEDEREMNALHREVTQDLSASVTARTEDTRQHFTQCMHTLTHKEYIYIYLYTVCTSTYTTTHTSKKGCNGPSPITSAPDRA